MRIESTGQKVPTATRSPLFRMKRKRVVIESPSRVLMSASANRVNLRTVAGLAIRMEECGCVMEQRRKPLATGNLHLFPFGGAGDDLCVPVKLCVRGVEVLRRNLGSSNPFGPQYRYLTQFVVVFV